MDNTIGHHSSDAGQYRDITETDLSSTDATPDNEKVHDGTESIGVNYAKAIGMTDLSHKIQIFKKLYDPE